MELKLETDCNGRTLTVSAVRIRWIGAAWLLEGVSDACEADRCTLPEGAHRSVISWEYQTFAAAAQNIEGFARIVGLKVDAVGWKLQQALKGDQ